MAATTDFISEINSKSMYWKLKVRIVRLWENTDRDRPDCPFSIEVILMDEKGDRIHASLGRSLFPNFRESIKEIGLYFIKNFVVCPNTMKLRIKDHKFKLMFTKKTVVEEIKDPHFSMSIFKFKSYTQSTNPQEFDNTELFDIIGEVVSYGDVQSIKQDDSVRTNKNISTTFWGDFVDQIKPYLNESNDKPIVVVMHLIRSHRFRDQISVKNTWHASKLYINSSLPQVDEFSSRIKFVPGESSQQLTHISSQRNQSIATELASGSVTVHEIEKLIDCRHQENYYIVAKIIHLEIDRGWSFLACKQYAKGVDEVGDKLYCRQCSFVESVICRYKLKVRVLDDTGTISVMLWDGVATKMIGKSAADLFETTGAAANKFAYPMKLDNIVDNTYMFKLELQSSDGQGQDEVFKVVTFTDDEDIIEKYRPPTRGHTFKDPDFNDNQVSLDDREFMDSTEDTELINVSQTPNKIKKIDAATVDEEDPNSQFQEIRSRESLRRRRQPKALLEGKTIGELKKCIIS
ncbi:hypothetical protein KY284_033230 [Solanum tuberosum]|nr:hypothetical protein KY284_033230 [Solanum tuberosum]